MKEKLSIIIPVLNEAENIPHLYSHILSNYKKNLQKYDLECVFINDGSTDTSLSEMWSLQKKDPRIKIISFRRTLGKSMALSEGFKRVTGDIIVTMDADLQDDAGNIPALLQKLKEGNDMVIGWRKNRQDNKDKTVPSSFFNFIVQRISGIKLHDFNSGLKVMRREICSELQLYGELHRYIPILAVQQGFKVGEVPVVHHKRKRGVSKYGWERVLRGFFDFMTVMFLGTYGNRPLHIFGVLGLISILLGTIFGAYLSVLHFEGIRIGNRPLLILAVLLVLGGLQLFAVGFLAELIVDRSRKDETLPIDYETETHQDN